MAAPNTNLAGNTPDVASELADYEILTPERVRLRYDIAGIGSRSAAALIDTAIQALIVIALIVLAFLTLALLPRARGSIQGPVQAGLGIIFIVETVGTFVVAWAYYLLFELAWSGQTPGKRAVGVRVIRENGYPIRAWDAVVRNLVRIVDGPPFGVVIGLLAMLLNARSRRLGDFAAGTIVVREAKHRSVSSITAADEASVSEASIAPPSLSAQDATLVRDVLMRRHSMEAQVWGSLAHRLAVRLAQAYGLRTPSAMDDEAFLESLTRT